MNDLNDLQRRLDLAEIEAAYWKTTAILAQGRLSRLTEGTAK